MHVVKRVEWEGKGRIVLNNYNRLEARNTIVVQWNGTCLELSFVSSSFCFVKTRAKRYRKHEQEENMWRLSSSIATFACCPLSWNNIPRGEKEFGKVRGRTRCRLMLHARLLALLKPHTRARENIWSWAIPQQIFMAERKRRWEFHFAFHSYIQATMNASKSLFKKEFRLFKKKKKSSKAGHANDSSSKSEFLIKCCSWNVNESY